MRPLEEMTCGYRPQRHESQPRGFPLAPPRYMVGYEVAKQLRSLAECGSEHATVQRLEEFRGSVEDLELAALMFERAGERANGANLRRSLPVGSDPGPAYLPTRRELLAADALDKAWVLAQLVRDEFSCPPERIRNAMEALEDAQRAWRECVLPVCAGDRPGGAP